MRWVGRRQSTNVEDRRGVRTGPVAVGGGIIGVIVILVGLFLGFDPTAVVTQGDSLIPGSPASTTAVAQDDPMSQFVKVVLADTEDMWTQQFRAIGRVYDAPRLVLYSGVVQTASGVATSATGPFYSPADQTIYIDLSFYQELTSRFGASGDFAQAYVIAHEVGHAVQDLLGTLDQVSALQQQVNDRESNQLSVRLELQADFYAGLWAHYAGVIGVLEEGDIEEALTAANAIGDDRIQMQSQGRIVPDSFTHGTSEQRERWFKLGYQSGDFSLGETLFSLPYDDL